MGKKTFPYLQTDGWTHVNHGRFSHVRPSGDVEEIAKTKRMVRGRSTDMWRCLLNDETQAVMLTVGEAKEYFANLALGLANKPNTKGREFPFTQADGWHRPGHGKFTREADGKKLMIHQTSVAGKTAYACYVNDTRVKIRKTLKGAKQWHLDNYLNQKQQVEPVAVLPWRVGTPSDNVAGGGEEKKPRERQGMYFWISGFFPVDEHNYTGEIAVQHLNDLMEEARQHGDDVKVETQWTDGRILWAD